MSKSLWSCQNENGRYYKADFGGLRIRLYCPDTPSIPEQHDKWLASWCDEHTIVGTLGDPMPEVFGRVRSVVVRWLLTAAQEVEEHCDE